MNATYIGAAPRAWSGGCTAVMHVRFAGQRFDVPLATLQVSVDSEDYHVKLAVARYLCLPDGAMHAYGIDRHPNGDLTIRPGAGAVNS